MARDGDSMAVANTMVHDKNMVNQTRSSCKIGDECTNKLHSGGKGSSTSDSASDSYGLRRSTRESSSKKPMIPSFPTSVKSERLEKQIPPTSVSMDPKKVKRQRTPSPVRRSKRCKKLQHSSDSAISNKSTRRSESSDRQNQMDEKENKAKQLEVEDKESSKSNEEEPASTQVKRGQLSARAYRAQFWKGNKDKTSDCREELSCPNESFQQEHNNSGAGPEEVDAVNGCSACNQKIKEGVESMTQTVEKQNEENTCLKQNNHSTQQDGYVCLENGQEDVHDKRSDSVYLISNVSAMAGCQNVTSAKRNFVQIDGINSKRKSGEPEATVNLELGEKQNLHVLVNIDEESGQSTCFIRKLGGKLSVHDLILSERGREIQNQKQKLQELEARKNGIYREYEAQKVLLESNHKLEAAIVRLHYGGSTKMDRMKRLDREYSTQIEECSRAMAMHLKEIDAEHLALASAVQQEPSVVEGDRRSTHTQLLNKLPEDRRGQESSNCHDQLDNADPFSRPSVDQSADAIVHAEKDCLPVKIGSDKDEMGIVASGTASTDVGPCANGTPIDNQGNAVSLNPCPKENLPFNSQGDFISNHALENDSTMDACTWVDQIPDGSRKEAIDKLGPVEVQESVHLTNILERSSSPDPQASETERPNGSESGVVDSEGPHKASLVNQSISRMPNGRDKVGATDHTLENISSLNACSLDDQIRDGSRMEALDELAAVEVQENICISGEPEEMISPDPHIPETEICNGSESEVLENVHPRDGPREVALVNQSKSTTVLPSRTFAEGATASSYCTLPDQELRDDCNATSTSRQERNAPNEEQHNDETLPEEESRDDCNVTSISMQEKHAPGKQQHDSEVASMTSHHSAPHQDLRDDCNPTPAIMQEGNTPDEEQQNAEGASMPSYLTLSEEELRVNCKAASTGMQERNAPQEEQHNAEGASISSCHMLSDQEVGDDFNAPFSSMQERNAPNEEQHNASQQTEFLSSSTGNAASSFSGAADMEPPVLLQLQDQPLNHSSHDFALVSGTATPLQGVGGTSNLTVRSQSTQLAENPAVPPNQAMSESAVSIPRGGMVAQVSGNSTASISVESSTQLLQSPFPMAQPRMPLKLHLDPLQNELDRIQREMEQMDKSHEDAKLLLVSDCGKEIEEIVAQIRRKYDLKLKEIEAEYLAKNKELDMNQGKVLMNRMLAEAFKSKCSDIRVSGANGIQQDVASGSMQQLLQLSSQRNAHQPLPVRGPSAGLQSDGVRTVATPFTGSENFPPNVASLRIVGPSGVTILDSLAVSSFIASRMAQVSLSMLPPSANIQAPSDLRSPAPYLQTFRPSIASSGTPSLGLPNQQSPSSPPPTSAPLQQLPLAAAPPAGTVGPSSWHHGRGSVGVFPPNEWGSDLLRDVFHPLIAATSQRDNLTSSGAPADVVCLSDDD
ncbi:uncharacterized protein LOC115730951 [Rhodamnia argentea]|uniref:Uncharacterized protein LOC115730951 n=1 Tax=Rhodamnia argentea TaxID=178133 RepID=A0ABM3HJG3_9MYRT|nr:uncharacterized protein LOC115730951 [Rhodamnia argentea]